MSPLFTVSVITPLFISPAMPPVAPTSVVACVVTAAWLVQFSTVPPLIIATKAPAVAAPPETEQLSAIVTPEILPVSVMPIIPSFTLSYDSEDTTTFSNVISEIVPLILLNSARFSALSDSRLSPLMTWPSPSRLAARSIIVHDSMPERSKSSVRTKLS